MGWIPRLWSRMLRVRESLDYGGVLVRYVLPVTTAFGACLLFRQLVSLVDRENFVPGLEVISGLDVLVWFLRQLIRIRPLFLLRRQQRKKKMIHSATAAMPPRTPPIIAPWLLECVLSELLEVAVAMAVEVVVELVAEAVDAVVCRAVASAIVLVVGAEDTEVFVSVEVFDVDVPEDLVVDVVVDEAVESSSGHIPVVHGSLEQQPL